MMFSQLIISGCNIDGANFEQTSLKGIDISTSTFNTLNVSMDELKGCKISSYQAIQFAVLMGRKGIGNFGTCILIWLTIAYCKQALFKVSFIDRKGKK